jgi:hypothetical protein
MSLNFHFKNCEKTAISDTGFSKCMQNICSQNVNRLMVSGGCGGGGGGGRGSCGGGGVGYGYDGGGGGRSAFADACFGI